MAIDASFHSIGFPCERGVRRRRTRGRAGLRVSIQLVSPARGEFIKVPPQTFLQMRFPFNWFPLREGSSEETLPDTDTTEVSIQLVSPARGEDLQR